ncbi:hypothetical protein VPH35_059862 [Triticum aestivum]
MWEESDATAVPSCGRAPASLLVRLQRPASTPFTTRNRYPDDAADLPPGDADADEVGDGGAHGALELEAEELRVALEHARHVAGLDVHPLEVLDDGREVDDDAGVEHLRVAAEQVRELVAADADLAEVVEDGTMFLRTLQPRASG